MANKQAKHLRDMHKSTHRQLTASNVAPSAQWWSTAFFAVAIFVPGHLFSWAVEWAWLGGTLIIGMLIVLNSADQPRLVGIDAGVWFTYWCLIGGLSAVSIAIAVALRHAPLEPRDAIEMLRFPVYGVMGLIIAACARAWSPAGIDRTLRIALWYILACTLIYVFEVPGLYQLLQGVIYAGAKTMIAVGFVRVSIPFENPNYLGFFLLPTAAYFIFFRTSALYLGLAIIGIFLTGSRSAWIALLPLLAGGFIATAWRFSVHELGFKTLVVWVAPAVIVGAMVIFWDELRYFSRLAELAEALQGGGVAGVKTADIRFAHVDHLLNWFGRSPWLGWGPGRALALDVADNQYTSWLVNWGIIGATLIVAGIVAPLLKTILSATRRDHLIGIMAFTATFALMIFTGDFLENYRMAFLYFFFLQIFYYLVTQPEDEPAYAVPYPQMRSQRG